MIVTDPYEGAEIYAVTRIRSAVDMLRAAVAAWEPRPMPKNWGRS